MRKREFQIKLKNCRKKQEPLTVKKSPFKEAIRNTTVLIMSTALISYPLNIPHTNAHFTDKITTAIYNALGMRTPSKLNTGAAELSFDIHRFNNIDVDIDVDFAENALVASISLPDGLGFVASDIIIDSVKFTYDDGIIDISPIDVETGGNDIKLTFNWREIESYLDSDDNAPVFDISGKGAGKGLSGLGEKFIFIGHGRTADLDKEFFEQMDYSYFIEGRQAITIPSEEDGAATYSYRFYIDNKVVPADEVNWKISPKIPGVEFESGVLSVHSNAQAANIVITAQLGSNRYFVSNFDIELIKVEEEIIEEVIDENVVPNPEPIEPGENIPSPTFPEVPGEDKKDDETKDENINEEDDDGSDDVNGGGDNGSADEDTTSEGGSDDEKGTDDADDDVIPGEGTVDDDADNDNTGDDGIPGDDTTSDDTAVDDTAGEDVNNDGTSGEGSLGNDTAGERPADNGNTDHAAIEEGSEGNGGMDGGI